MGGGESSTLGLWVFDLESQQASQILDGSLTMAAWSRDRLRLAFDVRTPTSYWEIWVADLDPNLSTAQALAPALTAEEYVRERLAEYTRALEVDPDNFETYLQRGDAYAGLAQWDEAVADYTQAIRTRPPENIRPYRVRAEAYLQLKEYEKAAADYDAYRKLLEAGDYPADGCNRLAWMYVTGLQHIRDPKKALPLALKAVQNEPNNFDFLNTLGMVYYRLGRFDEATETLLRSVESNKEGGTAFDFFFLAMSYQELGQSEKAKQAYDKAVEWWDPPKAIPPEWTELLTAFRAEADLVLGKK